MNLRYRLQRFMVGRYGADDLYRFLLWVYVLLFVVDLFFDFKILNILELFIVLVLFYRFFSRNISKRRRENNYYLRVKKVILKPIFNLKKYYQERDLYVYKRCFGCKTILRLPLPSKRGIQHVKCPKCKKRITFFCFRKEKIEFIKKK